MAKWVMECNNCGADFGAQFNSRKESLGKQKVEVSYLVCPECGQEYIVSIVDDKCKQLQKELFSAQEAYRNIGTASDDQIRYCRREVSFCKKRLQRYEDKLMRKYHKEKKRGQ